MKGKVTIMPSIIECIIEIDSIAQSRLDQANKIKIDIEKEVDETSKQTIVSLEAKARARIEEIVKIDDKFTNEKIENIVAENNISLAHIEKYYTDNHEAIEDKVFNKIIGK